jgi:hypothetical protein
MYSVKLFFWAFFIFQIIKSQHFETWILLSSSGKRRGNKRKDLSVEPPGLARSGLKLDQQRGPAD